MIFPVCAFKVGVDVAAVADFIECTGPFDDSYEFRVISDSSCCEGGAWELCESFPHLPSACVWPYV